ncbi:MAG: hypothetical protein EBR30_20215 [Cytophagia bacterium]|nr:hypothetical protein [Cytophagia bacterium]
MISIRHFDYELKQNPELAFTRLDWAVEKVDNLESQLISSLTIDTNRPWVGVLEKDILRFGIIEPRGILRFNFFQIVVRGKIHQIENGSRLEIKIRLGIYTILKFLFICLITGFFIYSLLTSSEPIIMTITGGVIWFTIFPVLFTILLNKKIDNVESKIRELFGIDEKEK